MWRPGGRRILRGCGLAVVATLLLDGLWLALPDGLGERNRADYLLLVVFLCGVFFLLIILFAVGIEQFVNPFRGVLIARVLAGAHGFVHVVAVVAAFVLGLHEWRIVLGKRGREQPLSEVLESCQHRELGIIARELTGRELRRV